MRDERQVFSTTDLKGFILFRSGERIFANAAACVGQNTTNFKSELHSFAPNCKAHQIIKIAC